MLQVRFFEVSEGELEDLRERFTNGQYNIDIEQKTFSMAEYNEMLACESLLLWYSWAALCPNMLWPVALLTTCQLVSDAGCAAVTALAVPRQRLPLL